MRNQTAAGLNLKSTPRIPPPSGGVIPSAASRDSAFIVSCTAHIALLAALLCVLPGCQSYEPRPLDLDATRAAWLSRTAGDLSVRDFAASLNTVDAGERLVFDSSDGLTLAEAEAVALVFNPELRLARLEANVARASADNAGLWQDPVLGVDMEQIVSGASGANPWVAGSTLGITIPISGRLEAEKARSGARLAARLDRLAAQEWATRAALRELWTEWSVARVRRDITAELIASLRDVGSLADRQEKAGSMTRVDARLFRVELAGREADMIAAIARTKELELQVRAMLGLAPENVIALVPSVTFATRSTAEGSLRRLMESNNTELAAIRAEYEVAEQSLRTEIRKQYPDLTIGPGGGTDQGDTRVLLGISLPIPLWNRNQQGVAEAAAEREVVRGRFNTTYEHLGSKLAIALSRFAAGKSQRAFVESSVVPLADEQEADVRRVAALGRVDPLLLLESLKTQYAAKLRLVEARAAESLGAIRIDELIGPSLSPSTQAPAPTTPAPLVPNLIHDPANAETER